MYCVRVQIVYISTNRYIQRQSSEEHNKDENKLQIIQFRYARDPMSHLSPTIIIARCVAMRHEPPISSDLLYI